MFRRTSRTMVLAAMLLPLLWSRAYASDESYWLLGAIGLVETTRLDANKIDIGFVPYIAWESGGFHIGIDEISYEFGTRDDIRWSLLAKPRYPLDSESSRFDVLERGFALELGGSVEVGFFPWVASATVLSDVVGTHNGQSVQFALGQTLPLGPGEIEFVFAFEVQSEKLAMHLYGISMAEASGELVAFEPGLVLKPSIAASYLMEIGERVGVQVQLELSTLSSEVSKSQRISDTVQAEAYIAIVRQF